MKLETTGGTIKNHPALHMGFIRDIHGSTGLPIFRYIEVVIVIKGVSNIKRQKHLNLEFSFIS